MINKLNYSYEIIGGTSKNRPLIVEYFGKMIDSDTRVLIIGSQHGDEKYARKSLKYLVSYLCKLNNNLTTRLDDSCIAILSDANPDGSIINSRLNAMGIDLNRDHQHLSSIENNDIHSFITKWNPDYVIDVHNYPAKRKYLPKSISLNYDVFVDIPNNPTIYKLISRKKMEKFLEDIKTHVTKSGFHCDRYFVFSSSGKVRHSTHDITNALNFMALRHQIPTFLVEGRQPNRRDDVLTRKNLVLALFTTIFFILQYLIFKKNRKYFHKQQIPQRGDPFYIRYKYKNSSNPLKVRVLDLDLNKEKQIFLTNYAHSLISTKKILLPFGYAIPKNKHILLDFLNRHGFLSITEKTTQLYYEIEYFNINEIIFSKKINRTHLKIDFTIKKDTKKLDNYVIFPVNQLGGLLLSLFFELDSKYHLSRYSDLDLCVMQNTVYPILRVV